jgi:hypothetical protein
VQATEVYFNQDSGIRVRYVQIRGFREADTFGRVLSFNGDPDGEDSGALLVWQNTLVGLVVEQDIALPVDRIAKVLANYR